jgi:uncharacterized protein involved in type VI secretion and phage assembly
VSTLVPALQALVREELGSVRAIELGTVTATYTNEGGSGDNNIAISVRLRGSALELQHVPVAIGRLGISFSPRVGDLVVLAFVGGDVNGAVAIGFVYVVPDDQNDDDRRFELQLPNGNKLTIQDGKVTIAMGQTSLVVESDGAITLDAQGDITLKSQGSLSLSAQTDVSIQAQASASLKGSTSVSIESDAQAQLKGTTTTISGTTSFSAS